MLRLLDAFVYLARLSIVTICSLYMVDRLYNGADRGGGDILCHDVGYVGIIKTPFDDGIAVFWGSISTSKAPVISGIKQVWRGLTWI